MLPFRSPLLGGGFGPIVAYEFLAPASATGSVDFTVPGLGWIPGAAIIVASDNGGGGLGDGIQSFATGSYAFVTSSGVRSTSWKSRDDTIASQNGRKASSTRCIDTLGLGSATLLGANFASFIPGGMRLDITDAHSNTTRISVVLFSSAMLTNVAIGTYSGASGTVNLGFQPSAIFTMSSYGTPFDGSTSDGVANSRGFISYDGVTTLRSSIYTGTYVGSPRQTDGSIGTAAIQGGQVTGTATGFDYTLADTNVTPGYLAIAGVDAWVGSATVPTATGSAPFPNSGGPSWKPTAAIMQPTSATAVSTNMTGGIATGVGAITGRYQFVHTWAPQDNSATPSDFNSTYAKAHALLNISGGTILTEGGFDGFGAGEVNTNYTTVDATARHMGGMLLRASQ